MPALGRRLLGAAPLPAAGPLGAAAGRAGAAAGTTAGRPGVCTTGMTAPAAGVLWPNALKGNDCRPACLPPLSAAPRCQQERD